MHDPTKRSLFEAHFQIGLYLKETFVPKAYLFFMNIQPSKDRQRKSSKTSSTDVKSKATANKKPLMVKSNKNHTKLSPKSTITIQEDEPSTPQMNGQTIKTPLTPEHDR